MLVVQKHVSKIEIQFPTKFQDINIAYQNVSAKKMKGNKSTENNWVVLTLMKRKFSVKNFVTTTKTTASILRTSKTREIFSITVCERK